MYKLFKKLVALLPSRKQSNTKSAPSLLPCLPPLQAPDDRNTKLAPSSSQCTTYPEAPERMNAHTAPPCSILWWLIDRKSWDMAIVHCHEYPQDAKWGEGGLVTPLYRACQLDAPLEVVRALIQANPEALEWAYLKRGDLPLHAICKSRSSSTAVLQELLSRPATACQRDKFGIVPLAYLWNMMPDCMKSTERSPWTPEQQEQIDMLWDMIDLLVDAIANSRQRPSSFSGKNFQQGSHQHNCGCSKNHINRSHLCVLYKIHALITLGPGSLHPSLLECLCDKYPQQLQSRDESGQLPLHLAVGFTGWYRPFYRSCRSSIQAMIRVLLSKYPEAARTPLSSMWDDHDTKADDLIHIQTLGPINGRYPLHIALSNHYEWEGGVLELFHAAPEVLRIRDPVTKLYPFQLAAIPSQNWWVDTETIFHLLRQCPDLLFEVEVLKSELSGSS